MNSLRHLAVGFTFAGLICSATATDPASPAVSATDLANRLSALRENGSSDVRLRMEVQQPAGTKKATYQIQIKERRTPAADDVAYIILWPKERKGEALFVRKKSGSAPIASRVAPGKSAEPLLLNDPVFGSDLAIADTIENFFAWKNQTIVGTEDVCHVSCQILESKPGSGDSSIYTRVRSWVDPRRLVPLKIEKYLPSGKLARRIETIRVVPQGTHGNLPANLAVSVPGGNSVTELDGSRIRYDVQFSDRDFSPESLNKAGAPQ